MDVTVNTIAIAGDKSFNIDSTYTAGSRAVVEESIPASATDLNIDVGISNTGGRLKFIGITAVGADMTVELMDITDTILHATAEFVLEADDTVFWPSYVGETAPAYIDTSDIATIRVTNNSDPAVAGSLVVSALYDPTA